MANDPKTPRDLPLADPEGVQKSGVDRLNQAVTGIDAALTAHETEMASRDATLRRELRTEEAYRFLGVHDLGVD